MTLTPVTFQRFGGLNLAVDEYEVAATGATDITNVDIDQGGQIKTRPGTSNSFVVVTGDTLGGLAAFETTSGTRQFVVGYANGGTETYAAYASTGGAAVATASPVSPVISAARWGNTSNEYLYIANGAEGIWRWTGAAFSKPAGMPQARHVAVTALSNRLVAARDLATNISRVWFSDAGDPETWPANNFVDLAPGDGTGVIGLVTWQDYVFAFKRDRFFVFYGESTDADGEPIFNYRPVDGFGALIPAVAGDEGVYFFDGRTVWLTTGGVPRRISTPVEMFLRGITPVGPGIPDQANLSSCQLSYATGRLYLAFLSGSVSGVTQTLVYDPKSDAWTLYSRLGYGASASFVAQLKAVGTDAEYAYVASMFNNSTVLVGRYDPSLSTDAGAAISWSYTTGRYALADPGQVAVVPETSLVGLGTVTVTISSDAYTSQGGSLTVGSGGAVAEGWVPTADQEGRWLKTAFSGTGALTVTQLKHYVSSAKPVGVG